MLAVNLELWVERGFLSITQLRERYAPDSEDRSDGAVLTTVRKFLLSSAARSVAQPVARSMWAGTEEILATVWYFREPLYVIDVLQTGEVHMRMYYLDVVTGATGPHAEECVRIKLLTNQEAHKILVTQINCRTIPLVLALHHGVDGGHFSAIRLPDVCYSEWTQGDPNGESAEDRLRWAHSLLGISVFFPYTHAKNLLSNPGNDLDYSDSSDVDSHDSDKLIQDALTVAGHARLTRRPSQQARTSSGTGTGIDLTQGLSQDSDFDLEATRKLRRQSSARSAQADDTKPVALLTSLALQSLLAQVGPAEVLHGSARKAYDTAVAANRVAATQWCRQRNWPVPKTVRSGASATAHILHEARPDMAAWVSLLSRLPYPEVALASALRTDVINIGKLLMVEARLLMLHDQATATRFEAAASVINEWSAVLVMTTDNSTRFQLAHNEERWRRPLAHPTRLHLLTRTVPNIAMDDLCFMCTLAACCPSAVPADWESGPAVYVTRSFLQWLAVPAHQTRVRYFVTEIRHSNWTGLATALTSFTGDDSQEAKEEADGRADSDQPAAPPQLH